MLAALSIKRHLLLVTVYSPSCPDECQHSYIFSSLSLSRSTLLRRLPGRRTFCGSIRSAQHPEAGSLSVLSFFLTQFLQDCLVGTSSSRLLLNVGCLIDTLLITTITWFSSMFVGCSRFARSLIQMHPLASWDEQIFPVSQCQMTCKSEQTQKRITLFNKNPLKFWWQENHIQFLRLTVTGGRCSHWGYSCSL